ncbi:unnamed protein product [Caenorhabditis nigoni]
MSSPGSVTSGGELDALEEWATTTIANVERELGAAMAEKDRRAEQIIAEKDRKIRDLENNRIEFGKKTEESEEAMRKLKGKLAKLENELVTQRKEIREVSEANVQWKTDLKKLSEEREEEVGEIQREQFSAQQSQLEVIGLQQEVMEKDAEIEDLKEQLRCSDMKFPAEHVLRQLERENKDAEVSKIQAAMGNKLSQKEELIKELFSKIREQEISIHNIKKGYEGKMAKLQEELKNRKDFLEEQRVLEAQRNREAERERTLMEQTIKDLSTALESLRQDQKWIPMMEEQLEDADKQLKSEKAARKLDSEARTAEIGKLNEEFKELKDQYDQENVLRNQLISKIIEMVIARSKSEEKMGTLKRELEAMENEIKMIMEYEKNAAEEASARYAKLQILLKRKHADDVEDQDSAKKRALERPETF